MTAPYLAPSLVRLAAERDVRWKRLAKLRRPAQDAWLGDAAHAARKSGHNPDPRGCVHARDFDVLAMNVPEFLSRVINDPRVWYVIYNGTIWSRTHAWSPRPYVGDPHTQHVHVSLPNAQEGSTFTPAQIRTAETTTTGFGLASLVTKGLVVRVVARLRRRGY